jgi:adenosylcobinamide-GDP ribazoletransferase
VKESHAQNAPAAKRVTSRIFEEIRLALGFLTILPVAPANTVCPQTVTASFRWFPLVGFVMGAVLCLEDFTVGLFLTRALRSAIVLMSLAIVTGAVHLDGLADTADALGAGRNRARALEILRDSRVGSFGALALVFVTVLKILALAELRGMPRYAALWLAPGLARWAMVAVAWRREYLRAQGAGSVLLDPENPSGLLVASFTAVVAVSLVASTRALLACVVAIAVAIALRAFYRRWLGGLTGDLIGAAGEIVEVCVLVAMAAYGPNAASLIWKG